MTRPYSDVRRDRSRISTWKPRDFSMISFASKTRRKVFDISPGQVLSLRDEPLTIRTRDGDLRFFWRRSAVRIFARVASHSTEMSYSGSANSGPAFVKRGDLWYSS